MYEGGGRGEEGMGILESSQEDNKGTSDEWLLGGEANASFHHLPTIVHLSLYYVSCEL